MQITKLLQEKLQTALAAFRLRTGEADAKDSFSPRPFVLAGYITVALAFGVFGTWAATAPLSSGVAAQGQVVVFSNRKVIQHLEGGIVSEIPVQEGDVVQPGVVLARLDPKQAQGNFDILSQRYNLLRATEARLQAESANLEEIEFPDDLALVDEKGEEPLYIRLQHNSFRDRLPPRKARSIFSAHASTSSATRSSASKRSAFPSPSRPRR